MICFTKTIFLLIFTFPIWISGQSTNSFGWNSNISTDNYPIVSTKSGLIRGFISETIGKRKIATFRGIPYGQPPVGSLRFQAPLKAVPWSGIKDGVKESPQCIQIDFMTKERRIRGQEDCLYLEVHTPVISFHGDGDQLGSHNKLLPVMVFIHGGSFASGAGGLYGPYYLLDQDIILVTINYRLGPFGFLSTGNSAAYGNAGLKDQVLALKWIQENIFNFGGDPDSVTIFGQSAGAGAVQHHIVSPMSRGLFHRGISQSGSSLCWWALSENAPEIAYKTGSLFGCQGNSEELVKCLQNISANLLVTAHLNLTDWNSFPIVIFAPVLEAQNPDAFLSEHPIEIYKKGMASKVPWINGFTKYEMGWLFSDFIQDTKAVAELNTNWERLGPIFLTIGGNGKKTGRNGKIADKIRNFYLGKENTEIGYMSRYEISQMLGDRFFLKCGLDGMHLHSKYTGAHVYGYEFSFEGKYSIVQLYGQDPKDWGVAHLDDIIYLLNNTEHFSKVQMTDTEEYKMSEILTNTWANFAKFGTPYVGKSKHLIESDTLKMIWNPIEIEDNSHVCNEEEFLPKIKFLDLNLSPKMIENPYIERYKFWSSIDLDRN